MTYECAMQMVRENECDQWVYNDTHGVFALRADVDLRIVRRSNPDEVGRDFKEEWANQHPDPNATRAFYEIYYGASLIHEFMLVAVDGCRADLPLPRAGTKLVPREAYFLARAVDHQGSLTEYMQRSGLSLEP